MTPREQRAKLLGPEAIAHLKQLSSEAPPLNDRQRAVIAAAMGGALKPAQPRGG